MLPANPQLTIFRVEIVIGHNREQRVDESKALFFSMLLALILAASILLLNIFYGAFLDPAFEFFIYYLPVALLSAMYVWRKLNEK